MSTIRISYWVLAGALALVAAPAHAATLRSTTVLHDDVVRLSDLFDGIANDRPIGPAPELGGQIFVEAPQLAAIARQFQVDWRSAGPADRIVLERPGKPFPREAAVAALRAALAMEGVSSDADVDMPGYTPPMLPIDAAVDPVVGQVDYDAASGRFTAVLSLTAPDMRPVHARLSGRVQELVAVPVAVRRLMPGEIIGSSDVQIARLRASAVRTGIAQDPAQAIGMALRHPVGPGAPFVLADLGRPMAVQKGETVQMRLEAPGLSLSAQGLAMDGGALGERVRVLNTNSRAVLEAEVTGSGRVRITGVTPIQLPGSAALPVQVATR